MNRKLVVVAFLIVCALGVAGIAVRGAGTNAAEEAAIRKIIASGRPPVLPDAVFWSGAYKRPTVGDEKPEPFGTQTSITNRVPGSQRTTTSVIRIVISDSGDLAYEYSKGTLDFDIKSGEHFHADTGLLRVWQKEDGQWKVAAQFVRPYDLPFSHDPADAKQ